MTTHTEIIEEFIEKGAELEHTRWAKWQQYVFDKSTMKVIDDQDFMCLPNEFYQRWARQIDTEYKDLSEAEKESDRREVRSCEPLLLNALHTARLALIEEIEKLKVQELSDNARSPIDTIEKGMDWARNQTIDEIRSILSAKREGNK